MLRSTPSPLTPEWLADRLAVSASQVAHPFIERADAQLCIRITGGEAHEHADAPDPLSPLCPRRQRPRRCRAAEQRDELASLHSIDVVEQTHEVDRDQARATCYWTQGGFVPASQALTIYSS